MSVRIYEIINPSDCVTLETENEEAAIAATIVLGGGAYGLRRDDDETVCPIMLFGGADWVQEKFGDLGVWVDANAADVADVLDTAMCCSMGDRRAVGAALRGLPAEERRTRLAAYNDERRSSLNNICGAAANYAKQLREVPTPNGGPR
jgi:hypothetical protein